MEWLRFIAAAALLGFGLFCFLSAVTGNLRFGYALNRMHSAGVGDTLGLLCVVLALAVASGMRMMTGKLLLVLAFLWVGSPVTTHFLAQVEYFNSSRLRDEVQDRTPASVRQEDGSGCAEPAGNGRETP